MANHAPPDDPNVMCQNATMACEVRGEPGKIYMRVYYQWQRGGPWELDGTRCIGSEDREPPPEAVREELVERWLPSADLKMNPPDGNTLIGLPTILYTEVQDPWKPAEPIVVLGQQIEAEADAVRFVWRPGDGREFASEKPGVPYAEGRAMSEYVTHKYRMPGTYTASVQVVWEVRWRVPGGPWRNLGELAMPAGGTVDVTAREKESRLGGNGDRSELR